MSKRFDDFAYIAALTLFMEEATSRGYELSDKDSEQLLDNVAKQ